MATYKITFHQSGGNLKVNEESGVARPISAYMAGQIESNCAYAVVKNEVPPVGKTWSPASMLEIKIMDMCTKKGRRENFLIFKLAELNGHSVKATELSTFITVSTHDGDYIIDDKMPPGVRKMYQALWTRSIEKLLRTLTELQSQYYKKTSMKNKKPWLEKLCLDNVVKKRLIFILAQKMGREKI